MSWKLRARWSKKRVARLGGGLQWVSVLVPVLLSFVYLGSLKGHGSHAIAQRRGESAPVVQLCPRCPPPVNIQNVFLDIFRARRNFYTGSAPTSNERIAFRYSQN